VGFENKGGLVGKDPRTERLVPLLITVMIVWVLYSLPSTVLYYLLLWTLASVPIGILMGHCVLRDQPIDTGSGCGACLES
jgi:hypothetical protein